MSLLGAMLIDPKVISDVIGIVPGADYFYSEAHAGIYEALVTTYDQHRSGDLVQFSEALKDREMLDAVGGADYLIQLAESVPSAASAPHYARIVRDKAQLRKLIDAAGQILYDAYHSGGGDGSGVVGGSQEVLDKAEQTIFNIADAAVSMDSDTLEHLLQETLDILDANFKLGRTITGVSSGFYDLDQWTCGLQPGEMIVVAARPSMGKTAFALNLAEQIAFGGSPHAEEGPHTPVGFFSMEMSRQAVAQRLLCAHSGVDSHKMRKNLLSHDDFRKLAESCGHLSDARMFIDDTPGLTVLLLRAKARRMAAQHGVKCLFIDYMQLMTAPSAARESRQAEVSAISRGIKALARELNIPVVCLAQLNRGAEQREGHRPRMADLRESGSIEQDADVVMLLHREEYYHQQDQQWEQDNPEKVGVAEVIIAKQRNGPTGTVELKWNAPITRFQSLAKRDSGGGTQSYAEPKPGGSAGFAPGGHSGPVANFRDGGGPEREDDVDDLPI